MNGDEPWVVSNWTKLKQEMFNVLGFVFVCWCLFVYCVLYCVCVFVLFLCDTNFVLHLSF